MDFGQYSNRKKRRQIADIKPKIFTKTFVYGLKVFVFAVFLVGIAGLSAGIGLVKAIMDSAPQLNIDDVSPTGFTTFIYDQDGKQIAELHSADANRVYVDLDQIPESLQKAVVSIEDERFYKHNGIDLEGIMRAIFLNLTSGDIKGQGASTLTQQVIKNNVLTNSVTFERKIQEWALAIELEKQWSKEQILENYLNTIALGRGTNGVETASRKYFAKDVWDLTLAESAALAATIQAPTYRDPYNHPDRNKEQQHVVLKKMLEFEYITEAEYQAALVEDVYTSVQANTVDLEESKYTYFVDTVIDQVVHDLVVQKGMSENQAFAQIYRNGLSIYTTQDTQIQTIVDEEFANEENFPPRSKEYSVKLIYKLTTETADGVKNFYQEDQFKTDEEAIAFIETYKQEVIGENDRIIGEKSIFIPQPQASMVITDYHTGQVKAIAGGRGVKQLNQSFDRAVEAYRQPGSTFKVLAAYLPGLDTGTVTLGTVFDDVPYEVVSTSGTWSPKNWYDTRNAEFNYWGLNTVRKGIEQSMNLLAVKTLNQVGINTAFDYLLDLGFTSLRSDSAITDKVLPLALGGISTGVNMLELTSAYGTIANTGVYQQPIFYTKVLDHSGNVLLVNESETHRVIKETTSFLLTSALQDVVNLGTGKPAKFVDSKMPVAGKTGTTSESKDLVFAGYTPYLAASLWMGYDTPKEMVYQSAHKPLWRKIMERIHTEKNYEVISFPKAPPGIVSASICIDSGKLAVPGLCDTDPRGSQIRTEYFEKGTEPTETCDVHIKVRICNDSGLFANEYCPEASVVEKTFIKRPEPLVPENWDPNNPPRIKDRIFEIPANMEGEYCNIHGPTIETPVIPEIVVPTEETTTPD